MRNKFSHLLELQWTAFNKNFYSFHLVKKYLIVILIFCFGISCTKFVEVAGPGTSINKDNVYETDATAISVLNGIYAKMSRSKLIDGTTINSFMSLYPGLSADEFVPYSIGTSNLSAYYKNALINTTSPNAWSSSYPLIFTINSALEGLNSSTQLSPNVKKQLLGEALFIRALHYFYLVSLYGDVPLVLTTDYKINENIPRTGKNMVFQQIEEDLKNASSYLSNDYLDINVTSVTSERIAPIKWAAVSLLARVYLYEEKYADAETEASLVINNTSLYQLVDMEDVFVSNSKETIWALKPVNSGWNTEDARLFVLPQTGPGKNWPVFLSNNLLNSFEDGDLRKSEWVDSVVVSGGVYYYPYKYKVGSQGAPVTEYEIVLRLAELYLIRAEARVKQDKLQDAVDDLNAIRSRAGLNNYSGIMNVEGIFNSILHERQVELFTEWGHRWLDLKRTKTIDSLMTEVSISKQTTWKTTAQFYPILLSELKGNPNLVQNPGY